MAKNYLLSILCIAAAFSAKAQTTVPALITSNQIWDLSGSPYLINQNTYIDTGVSVLVKPGVEVRSSGNYVLSVAGEFNAQGKSDTIIRLRNFEISYLNKSKKFNPLSLRGAFLNYCHITGNGSGTYSVKFTGTDIHVSNCVFTNSYNSIYGYGSSADTITIGIIGNSFSGDQYGNGTPIYCMNSKFKMDIRHNRFFNTSIIYLDGNYTFSNNTLRKMNTVSFYVNRHADIRCNSFLNFSSGINIYLFNSSGLGTLAFSNNTLDSMGSSVLNPMLKINRNSSSNPAFGSMVFENNNFFRMIGTAGKVQINASNSNPLKSDSLNFGNCYWGSNDSATIESYIRDYSDNINVFGRVNAAGYQTSPVIGCSYNRTCAEARFIYSISDSAVVFTDSSISKEAYLLKWNFGDGSPLVSDSSVVSHRYKKLGTYTVCLYVYDTLNNLCDSSCSAIEITSIGKCKASFYFAVDTSDSKRLFIINNSKGTHSKTNYHWTFGNGSDDRNRNPVYTYPNAGKYVICLIIIDSVAGCHSTMCDTIDIKNDSTLLLVLNEEDILNIKQQNTLKPIRMFPNPGNGLLNILFGNTINGTAQIHVCSADGKTVYTENQESDAGRQALSLNLQFLENGVYMIRILTTSGPVSMPYILEK